MDALWFGCVPVIISDRYVLPMENLLNWNDIAYRIPESQVSNNTSICNSQPYMDIACGYKPYTMFFCPC